MKQKPPNRPKGLEDEMNLKDCVKAGRSKSGLTKEEVAQKYGEGTITHRCQHDWPIRHEAGLGIWDIDEYDSCPFCALERIQTESKNLVGWEKAEIFD